MPEWAFVLILLLFTLLLCFCNGWLEHLDQGQEGREGSRDIQWGVAISSGGSIQLDIVIGSSFGRPVDDVDPEGGGQDGSN